MAKSEDDLALGDAVNAIRGWINSCHRVGVTRNDPPPWSIVSSATQAILEVCMDKYLKQVGHTDRPKN